MAVNHFPKEINIEDRKRAIDRRKVQEIKSSQRKNKSLLLFWLLIGPGVLVMLGENDAPSMLSYAATGSTFGVGFFIPFVLLTFFMAYIVQEMTLRIGATTHQGHAQLIFDRFGSFWGWFAIGDLLLGNFLTLVTEFIGVRAGLGFFNISAVFSVILALGLVVGVSLTQRYWTWERITLGLAVFNLVFVPVALMTHPNLGQTAHALLFWNPLPGGFSQKVLFLMMADIGATVTPWMLYFHQSAVADKGLTTEDIPAGRRDIAVGAILAAIGGIAAVIAAAPLFARHISAQNFAAAQFAQALEPIIGRWGAALFALGIFEAGLVAIITISSSSGYAFGEITAKPHSLNRPVKEAWPFYAIIFSSAVLAAVIVLTPNAPLEYIALIVNVIATLAMPPALLFVLLLANDREIMKRSYNSVITNVIAIAIVVFISLTGVVYGVLTVFPHLNF